MRRLRSSKNGKKWYFINFFIVSELDLKSKTHFIGSKFDGEFRFSYEIPNLVFDYEENMKKLDFY